MKDSILTFVILLILVNLLNQNCNAQFYKDKISIYPGIKAGLFHGKENYVDDDFIYPNLYSNFKSILGPSLKALYKLSPSMRTGIAIEQLTATNWEHSKFDYYNEANVKFQSISCILHYRPSCQKIKLPDKLHPFFELALISGFAKFNTEETAFSIFYINIDETSCPTKSYLWAGNATAGVELELSNAWGLQLNYTFQGGYTSSYHYAEKYFLNSQLTFGAVFNL